MQQENERRAGLQNAAVGVASVNVHVEQMRERWEKMAAELKVGHFLDFLLPFEKFLAVSFIG